MRFAVCLFSVLSLTADPPTDVVPADRIQASLERMMQRNKDKDLLLYTRRQQKRELTADGKVEKQTILTLRRDPWDELVVTRVIAKDDKPLPADQQAKQEERLRKQIETIRRTPPQSKLEEYSFLREVPSALLFRRNGSEIHNGRPCDIITFEPRPGYKAKQTRAKLFEKIRGQICFDQTDGEVAKINALVFDNVNLGFGLLGKIDKGTQFEMDRKKWDIGVWFEQWQRIRFDVRIMMVKNIRQEIETNWSNLNFHPRSQEANR
ncbi:MAG: hypothetical protein ACK52Z_18485 [Acidobacteriota bacterium]|jgi:hypothetical protein